MKKALFAMMAVATLGTAPAALKPDGTYPSTMVITGIDKENDILTMTDARGNDWAVYGVEDYMIGDVISTTMYKNGDDNIYNDVIIDMQFSGYYVEDGELYSVFDLVQ